ncbi:hypothetical protein AMTRI_Chr08g203880 [Amborella trichopoda]
MRNRVLEIRHLFFGGSDDKNYELVLDRVSDTEIVFRTKKPLWLSDAPNSSAEYCYKTFIARLIGDTWLGWLHFPSISSIIFLPTQLPENYTAPLTYLSANYTSPSIYLLENHTSPPHLLAGKLHYPGHLLVEKLYLPQYLLTEKLHPPSDSFDGKRH